MINAVPDSNSELGPTDNVSCSRLCNYREVKKLFQLHAQANKAIEVVDSEENIVDEFQFPKNSVESPPDKE